MSTRMSMYENERSIEEQLNPYQKLSVSEGTKIIYQENSVPDSSHVTELYQNNCTKEFNVLLNFETELLEFLNLNQISDRDILLYPSDVNKKKINQDIHLFIKKYIRKRNAIKEIWVNNDSFQKPNRNDSIETILPYVYD